MDKITIDGTDIEIHYTEMISSNLNQLVEILNEAREDFEHLVNYLDDGDICFTDHPIAKRYEAVKSGIRNAKNMAYFMRVEADEKTTIEKELETDE